MPARFFFLIVVTFTLFGCAPHVNFYPVRQFPRPPKSATAHIEILPDPPGKPYQFLGLVTAFGIEDELIGNTESSTSEALLGKAREIGADALIHGKVQSGLAYLAGSYSTTHRATAYAISWASPTDSTFIPGDTSVKSIVETAEDDIARRTGKVSMKMLRSFKVGESTERDVTRILGDPLVQNEMEMTMYIKTFSYRVEVVDFIEGSKMVTATFQFNKDGKLTSRMIL
jgi:hypothetical protein